MHSCQFTQTQTHRFLSFSLYHTIKHKAVCLLFCTILLNVMQFLSFIFYHTIKCNAVPVFIFYHTVNPFTAPACKISGLKSAANSVCLQTVYAYKQCMPTNSVPTNSVCLQTVYAYKQCAYKQCMPTNSVPTNSVCLQTVCLQTVYLMVLSGAHAKGAKEPQWFQIWRF